MPGRIPGCVGSPRAALRAAAPGAVLSGAGYLSQAEALFAAHPSVTRDQQPAAALCEQFDRLRWFELPQVCLATPLPSGDARGAEHQGASRDPRPPGRPPGLG
jgi:hypothetical protein